MNVAQLECKIEELFMLLRNTGYKTTLQGTSFLIPKSQHQLGFIKGVTVFNLQGKIVRTAVRVNSDLSVLISSNIPLDEHTVIIY